MKELTEATESGTVFVKFNFLSCVLCASWLFGDLHSDSGEAIP